MGIKKRIKDIIDGLEDVEEHKRIRDIKKENRKYEDFTEPQVLKEISKLEKVMHKSARDLDFESAAKTRDQIKFLKEKLYGANLKDRV